MLGALSCLAALPIDAGPPEEKDYQDAITSLDSIDPHSPAALNARLEYSDFLAGSTADDCQQRLDHAQSLLDSVVADPVAAVVLPIGPARAENIEYRLHTSRASCSDGSPRREAELQKALKSAQRASDLYRDALDYRSMAIMQFDIGVTYRLLGNDSAAVAALESAIDADREYGFREDAEENGKLLKLWSPQAAATGPAGLRLSDSPSRSVSPRFAWRTCDVSLGVAVDAVRVDDGVVTRGRGSNTLNRHIRRKWVRWIVADEPGTPAYEGDAWPKDPRAQRDLAQLLTRDLLQFPGMQISHSGDLENIVDTDQLAAQLTTAAQALARNQAPGGGTGDVWSFAKGPNRVDFSATMIEAEAAQNYNFETGTWIGASLNQGVWYQMSAMLPTPGLHGLFMTSDIEFAYTHNVPCRADSTDRSCIEVVVHITPRWDAMQSISENARRELNLRPGQTLQYWSTTYLRLVTDPHTLMVQLVDTRHYWHLSYGAAQSDVIENASERTLSTFSYH
jgi:tetratricopeptide (TPR) repeat protein